MHLRGDMLSHYKKITLSKLKKGDDCMLSEPFFPNFFESVYLEAPVIGLHESSAK